MLLHAKHTMVWPSSSPINANLLPWKKQVNFWLLGCSVAQAPTVMQLPIYPRAEQHWGCSPACRAPTTQKTDWGIRGGRAEGPHEQWRNPSNGHRAGREHPEGPDQYLDV